MALLNDLLMSLERQDTYPAADALERVMLGGEQLWPEGSMAALWQTLPAPAQSQLAAWAESRLDHWHSLKVNALCSAWENDPGDQIENAQRCDAMLRPMLLDLRSGLASHPELVADAVALQHMAETNHGFSWSQAYREILDEQAGFELAPDSPDFVLYCQLSAYAFRWLTGPGVS
jgi:hypothetical protein